MKIWKSYSGEHSAKLKIVANFKTSQDAQAAANALNDLIQQVQAKATPREVLPKLTSSELLHFYNNYKMGNISSQDTESANFLYDVQPSGKAITIDTDDIEIQALTKIFINYGAKLEMYSRHDYP